MNYRILPDHYRDEFMKNTEYFPKLSEFHRVADVENRAGWLVCKAQSVEKIYQFLGVIKKYCCCISDINWAIYVINTSFDI